MFVTWRRLLRARPVQETGLALVAFGVGVYFLAAVKVPSFAPTAQDYSATVVYSFAPVVSSVLVLGVLGSHLSDWENQARRALRPCRAALAVAAMGFGVVILLPSAPSSGVDDASLVAVRGVLTCSGIGMLLVPLCGFPGQAATVFGYGLVSLSTARLVDAPWTTVLAIAGSPTTGGMAVAVVLALLGVLAQSGRSRPTGG